MSKWDWFIYTIIVYILYPILVAWEWVLGAIAWVGTTISGRRGE